MTPFLRAEGTTLRLGDRAFGFVGGNRYDTLSSSRFCCGRAYDDAELERLVSELASCGATVLRTWAFPRFFDGGDFAALDRLIAAARRHDVRLVLTLENQWQDCSAPDPTTADGRKGAAWFAGGWRETLAPHLQTLITRYREEPQIAMWQLMNEAECEDAGALLGFARDASAMVRALDPNHLISLGTMGTGQAGTTGAHYRRLHELPTIDLVEAHDYGEPHAPLPRAIAADLEVARALDKPFFIGEAGIATPALGLEERARRFADKISAAHAAGVAGYLVWSFYDLRTPASGWDFAPDDPLADVLRGVARTL